MEQVKVLNSPPAKIKMMVGYMEELEEKVNKFLELNKNVTHVGWGPMKGESFTVMIIYR